MRALTLLTLTATLAVVVAACSSAARDSHLSTNVALARLTLDPAVAPRGRAVGISVAGLEVPALEARLSGATVLLGRPLPWEELHVVDGAWRGLLAAPEFRGIYPVELRIRNGSRIFRSERWLLRIFARGTQSRPSFDTPDAAARWWVTTLPYRAKVAAMRRWQRPKFDHRDRRLHRLFVIAYSQPGHPAVRDRLGMFVTAVRDGFHGPWRLLEATVEP